MLPPAGRHWRADDIALRRLARGAGIRPFQHSPCWMPTARSGSSPLSSGNKRYGKLICGYVGDFPHDALESPRGTRQQQPRCRVLRHGETSILVSPPSAISLYGGLSSDLNASSPEIVADLLNVSILGITRTEFAPPLIEDLCARLAAATINMTGPLGDSVRRRCPRSTERRRSADPGYPARHRRSPHVSIPDGSYCLQHPTPPWPPTTCAPCSPAAHLTTRAPSDGPSCCHDDRYRVRTGVGGPGSGSRAMITSVDSAGISGAAPPGIGAQNRAQNSSNRAFRPVGYVTTSQDRETMASWPDRRRDLR